MQADQALSSGDASASHETGALWNDYFLLRWWASSWVALVILSAATTAVITAIPLAPACMTSLGLAAVIPPIATCGIDQRAAISCSSAGPLAGPASAFVLVA